MQTYIIYHIQPGLMNNGLSMELKFNEYFMLVFLKYPKVKHIFEMRPIQFRKRQTGSGSSTNTAGMDLPGHFFGKLHDMLQTSPFGYLNRSGIYGLIDGSPYMVLLFKMLQENIPHSGSSSGARGPAGEPLLSTNQETFVRLMAESWIDIALLVRKNHAEGAYYMAEMQKMVNHYQQGQVFDHPPPDEVMTMDSNSMTWEIGHMQCLYIALTRMLSEPKLAEQYASLGDIGEQTFQNLHNSSFYSQKKSYGQKTSNQVSPCCPGALSMMQQPMFDMLRTAFNRADWASSGWETHALMVECWLLYIQPWMAPALAEGSSLESINSHMGSRGRRGQTGNNYDKNKWLPYIAANLHFYTTVLSSFIKYSSCGDISAIDGPGLVNLVLVEKVLVAFEPIKDDVEELVRDFKAWYPDYSRDLPAQNMNMNMNGRTPGSTLAV